MLTGDAHLMDVKDGPEDKGGEKTSRADARGRPVSRQVFQWLVCQSVKNSLSGWTGDPV